MPFDATDGSSVCYKTSYETHGPILPERDNLIQGRSFRVGQGRLPGGPPDSGDPGRNRPPQKRLYLGRRASRLTSVLNPGPRRTSFPTLIRFGPNRTSHPHRHPMLPKRFHRLRSVLARRQPDLTVLMERVHKEHNVSAILRNCDAVGVLDVHAVAPAEGIRVHHDTSGGTAKWIPVHRHEGIRQAVSTLKGDGFQLVAAHPGSSAVDYREVDYTRPTALLVGTERFGVSEEALELVDVTAVIPMVGMVRSLNVSVATSLFLFEAYRQREVAGYYEDARLDPHQFRRILFEWAYPDFARRFQEAGEPYPELGPDGEILGSPLPTGESPGSTSS